MMAVTTLPEAPSPDPRPVSPTTNRFVTIRANLLPDEIVAKRRLGELKRRMLIVLAVLLVLLIAWYALALLRTTQANSDRSSAQRKTISLQGQVQQFAPLVAAQSQSAAIKAELTKLMVGDLQWKDMLATLRNSAKGGVVITSVSGNVTSGAASVSAGVSGAGLGVLNQSGHQQVGTLTILGTAPDKNAVAAYIDALTKVTGLAAPFPASVTGQSGKLMFTANVIITSNALGGRYSTTTQGGH
jgi:Tfp pilus assembly protein PilN